MRALARSARPPSRGSKSQSQEALRQATMRRAPLRGRRPELRPTRPDGAQPLGEAGPGPGLDFAVADGRLPTRRLEGLEPGVRLLDQQEFLRLKRYGHGCTSHVVNGRIVGPRSDGTGPGSPGRRGPLLPCPIRLMPMLFIPNNERARRPTQHHAAGVAVARSHEGVLACPGSVDGRTNPTSQRLHSLLLNEIG